MYEKQNSVQRLEDSPLLKSVRLLCVLAHILISGAENSCNVINSIKRPGKKERKKTKTNTYILLFVLLLNDSQDK
jgi:hypothetical protein